MMKGLPVTSYIKVRKRMKGKDNVAKFEMKILVSICSYQEVLSINGNTSYKIEEICTVSIAWHSTLPSWNYIKNLRNKTFLLFFACATRHAKFSVSVSKRYLSGLEQQTPKLMCKLVVKRNKPCPPHSLCCEEIGQSKSKGYK